MAFCVPLIDEDFHFNIQLSALHIYQVERARGLDFIEPVVGEDVRVREDPRHAVGGDLDLREKFQATAALASGEAAGVE